MICRYISDIYIKYIYMICKHFVDNILKRKPDID